MRNERFVINDRNWALIEPLLPGTARDRGVTAKNNRLFLVTCRGSFIQSQLEPRIGLRHLARLVQRSGGGAGRGCAAGRTLPVVWC
jgi:hypothetical protein